MIEARIAANFEVGRWRRGYIRGKIRHDPAYAAVHEALRERDGALWDAGCGLGLLAFYLRERGWRGEVVGSDLDAGKVAQGNATAARHYPGVRLRVGSVASPPDGFRGHVAMLDVLHYLDAGQQHAVLQRIAAMVPPGGVALIRYTARDQSWRHRVTRLEEFLIRRIGWIRSGRIHFPATAEVVAPFRAAGWATAVRPLWGRTPFNSYLLTATRPLAGGDGRE